MTNTETRPVKLQLMSLYGCSDKSGPGKYFTAPKRISPFYDSNIKIPRKLKKKAKLFCGVHWKGLTNAQRLWHYMDKSNIDYKLFIIKQICISNNLI